MFTGLIQDIGTVVSLSPQNGGKRIGIETQMDLSGVPLGASIACSGVCMTVVEKNENRFFIEASPETLRKTIIENWATGTKVNLEPSLRLGDELGGHFVFGHVDGRAVVKSIRPEGNSTVIDLQSPDELRRFLAPKGSVALDGVSLTVNEVRGDVFSVAIIPHTWSHTTLRFLKAGESVNIEIDMLARYVARMMEAA